MYNVLLIITITSCAREIDRSETNTAVYLEKVNEHLQHTYKWNINQFTLTGEVTKEPACNLYRTYTVLKLEY